MVEIIYLALYNDCIYESSARTLSAHRTKEGAEKAIADHKFNKQKEHDEMFSSCKEDDRPDFTFDWDKWWGVEECEIID